jgi:peptide/nickel transport system substrate-binding protein
MQNLTRRQMVTVAAVAGAALLMAGCTPAADEGSDEPTSFTMSVFPTGTSIDPWKAVISQYAIQASYDTLTHLDGDGNVVPWLATDWEFTDDLTLQMNLEQGIEFTDGTPFNAEAIKANIEYSKTAQPFNFGAASTLATIASVEVVDDDTVNFHLATPNPDLPYGLSYLAGYVVSPTALANDPESLETTPVGTGPYLLDESATVSGDTYTYTRNPDYWAADRWEAFDTLVLKVMGDPTARENAAAAGELDYEEASAATNIPGWEITEGSPAALQGLTIYDLNGSIVPALADVRVRQAMNYAIDRETILAEVFNGVGSISASTPFSPDSEGYSEDLLEIYPYDPDKARELLAEAGYADGFSIQVLSNPAWSLMAQAIAGYLREVGINVEPSEHTTDLIQQTMSGTWAVAVTLQPVYGLPYTDVGATMTASGWMNPLHNSDPQIQALLEEAATETDDDARAEIYGELAAYAAEQAWFVSAVVTSELHAHNPEVVDVTEPKNAGAPLLWQLVPAE